MARRRLSTWGPWCPAMKGTIMDMACTHTHQLLAWAHMCWQSLLPETFMRPYRPYCRAPHDAGQALWCTAAAHDGAEQHPKRGTDLHVQLLPLQEDLPDLGQVVAAHGQDLPLLLAGQAQRLRQAHQSPLCPGSPIPKLSGVHCTPVASQLAASADLLNSMAAGQESCRASCPCQSCMTSPQRTCHAGLLCPSAGS